MAMDFKDYYKILGLPRTASDKEIKAAYRKLARKHHPDLNAGNKQAEARFKEINEANAVLSDPEKRQRYDQLGANWDSFRNAPPGAGGWPGGGRVRVRVGGFGTEDLGGFSDFFRTFFGGAGFGGGGFSDAGGLEDLMGQAAASQAAAARELEVELTLDEVLRGTTRALELGSAGSKRRVEVKIPAGVREGSKVRVPGAAAGAGARGDIYLRVKLLPDARFERKGDDLQIAVHVPLTTAVLGGEVQVPTLDGAVGIKVPPGTPNGRTFRLRGHGLPKLDKNGERGDVLASLSVDLPPTVGTRERELFEELRGLGH
jgi:curved DNA-binding protein